MKKTIELYNTKDVTSVRELLIAEQNNRCALTGIPIPDKQHVLDHDHNTQYVRAVLHRQANAVLGKIENLWVRYLSYWYPHDLPTFLRQTADYLERKQDTRWYHPGWIKRVNIDFNKLTATEKRNVLAVMQLPDGKNNVERVSKFKKAVLTKLFSFPIIADMINKQKGS